MEVSLNMKNAISLMSVLFTQRWVKENCPKHKSLSLDAESLYIRKFRDGIFKLVILISLTVLALIIFYQIVSGEGFYDKTSDAFIALVVIFFTMVYVIIFFNSIKCSVEKRLLKDWIEKRPIILRVDKFALLKECDSKNDLRDIISYQLQFMRSKYKNMLISPELCDHESFLLSAKNLHELAVYCELTNRKFEEFWG
jgi:hypothetical protein